MTKRSRQIRRWVKFMVIYIAVFGLLQISELRKFVHINLFDDKVQTFSRDVRSTVQVLEAPDTERSRSIKVTGNAANKPPLPDVTDGIANPKHLNVFGEKVSEETEAVVTHDFREGFNDNVNDSGVAGNEALDPVLRDKEYNVAEQEQVFKALAARNDEGSSKLKPQVNIDTKVAEKLAENLKDTRKGVGKFGVNVNKQQRAGYTQLNQLQVNLERKIAGQSGPVNDIEKPNTVLQYDKSTLFQRLQRRYIVNCSNINEIQLGRFLADGWHKTVFAGTFRGREIAVKVVKKAGNGTSACIDRILGTLGSGTLSNIKATLYHTHCDEMSTEFMLHEILHHVVLDDPNIVRHLGYCIRHGDTNSLQNGVVNKSTSAEDVMSRSIISVFEYGSVLTQAKIATMTWRKRVEHCRDIAGLLVRFHRSILGSILYCDFKLHHLLLVNGTMKLSDLDNRVSSIEPRCGASDPSHTASTPLWIANMKTKRLLNNNYYAPTCKYNLRCMNNTCSGVNALDNLVFFNTRVFKKLLILERSDMPAEVYKRVDSILKMVDSRQIRSAIKLKVAFDDILRTANRSARPHISIGL